MDLLCILNDVLHTDKFHRRSMAKPGIFASECGGFVADLIEQAAAYISEKDSQPERKLRAIINYWAVNQLLSAEDLKAGRAKADEALFVAQGGTPVRKRTYILPEYHGDQTAAFNDLPASYMLEPMIKDPKKPINPRAIKVQKLDKKPASPFVRNLFDNFRENIDLKYTPTGDNPTSETSKYRLSLDPMGQLVKQNKETGETATATNAYGWSAKFCQDMRQYGVPETIKIAREDNERTKGIHDVRSPSQPRGDGRWSRRSSTADSGYRRERKRYNRSRSRSRSYDRRGSASSYASRRSPSSSRSRDMNQGRRMKSPRPIRRGSDDRGRNYEDQGPNQGRPPSRSYDREASQSRRQWNTPGGPNQLTQGSPGNNQYHNPPMLSQNYGQGHSQPQQPNLPGHFPGQFPMPQYGVPPPPPPPFHGPGGFVPPPPPPPMYNAAWGPPPPPNPNVSSNGQQYGNQHGNNFGPGNNPPYGQNRGGRGGHRGPRGGYNGNRGGGRGDGRGGRF
ncbi:hypothetical protein BDW02DRAFT_572934 [Decorospora gaudefroyi]|uniref:CID domain-containing protein n=1 Tax=Decorospora gaudefroyi TaxID=184978 RepID=A0A6A5K1A5_9PLEO|nr:hypothetical protein BDW02DRAFT_572934 [Decorospora gaudefroyi]